MRALIALAGPILNFNGALGGHLFLVVLRKGSHGVLLLLLFELSCSSAIMVITVGGRQLKGRYEFRKRKREKERAK